MNEGLIIALIVLGALAFFRLYRVNKAKELRYEQYWVSILLVLFGALAFGLSEFSFFARVRGFIEVVMKAIFGPLSWLKSAVDCFYYFAIIFIFAQFKKKWIGSKKIDEFFANFGDSYQNGLNFYIDSEEGKVLKAKYVFPLAFFRTLIFIATLLLILSFFSIYERNAFPAFLVLILAPIVEFFWFLNGKPESVYEEDIEQGEIRSVDFLNLWEEYQQVWPDHYSAAVHISNDEEQRDNEILHVGKTVIRNVKYQLISAKVRELIVASLASDKNVVFFVPQELLVTRNNASVLNYFDEVRQLFLEDVSGGLIAMNPEELGQKKIWITSADDFVDITYDTNFRSWLKQVSIGIYVDFDLIMNQSPDACLNASKILTAYSEHAENLTLVTLNDDRENTQSAITSNIQLPNFAEIRMQNYLSKDNFYMLWNAEANFEEKLFKGSTVGVGPSFSLSGLALCYSIEKLHFLDGHNAIVEGEEELLNNRDSWNLDFREKITDSLEEIRNRFYVHYTELLLKQEDSYLSFIYDNYYNAPYIAKKFSWLGVNEVQLHIVSPQHLFRNYFALNFNFFHENPLKPLAGKLLKKYKTTTAISLVDRLTHYPMRLKDIERELDEKDASTKGVIKALEEMFVDVFQMYNLKEFIEVDQDKEGDYLLSMKKTIRNDIDIFKKVFFRDEAGAIVHESSKNLVFQKYRLGQTHNFFGRYYKISKIKEGENIEVSLVNIEPKFLSMYKSQSKIQLGDERSVLMTYPSSKYELEMIETEIEIHSKGYFHFYRGFSLKDQEFEFVETPRSVKYKKGRVLCWTLKLDHYKGSDHWDKLKNTLVILLQESLKSHFPESHEYLIVSTSANQNPGVMEKGLKGLYSLENDPDEEKFTIYFVEDSFSDLGHLFSLAENLELLLERIADYLNWVMQMSQWINPLAETPVRGYVNRYQPSPVFLGYGLREEVKIPNHLPKELDLNLCIDFFNSILPKNQVTADRKRYYKDLYSWQSEFVNQSCDFCGKKNCSYHNALLLSDGRVICRDCESENRRTQKEFDDLLETSMKFYSAKWGITEWPGIKITTNTAQEIAKFMGGTFTPTQGYDRRAVGLAVGKGTDYSILIENYRSELDTLITIIHEMCHIWQYSNLNFQRMKKKSGLFEVEGHATWTEVQYLKHLEETTGVSLANKIKVMTERDDEYGKGYKLITRQVKNMRKESAFQLLKEKYPK